MSECSFKAGFARVDITPPLGTPIVGYFEERHAKGILDNLEANAVAFSDGNGTAVVITADLLGIEGVAFNASLRRRIADAAGVRDDAVYVHCTHTHTGPGAVAMALMSMSPFRVMGPSYLRAVSESHGQLPSRVYQ